MAGNWSKSALRQNQPVPCTSSAFAHDGYHELRTIFQSIALHDTLTIRAPARTLCAAVRRPGVSRRSRRIWCGAPPSACGRRQGVAARCATSRFSLAKRIPLQAGLGGGSSDAAATLRALGSLWRVDDGTLREMAASLGADVPYFLEGGTVLGLDRGDRLYPLVDHRAGVGHVGAAAFGVSTADAYPWWDEDLAGPEKAPRRRSAACRPDLVRSGV